jgi:TRAP-type C4-dicarboxylate transport system permease large subunit
MLLLTLLGMPIVFSMFGASLLTILVYRDYWPLELTTQYFVAGLQSYPLLALAFFFLVGEWMNAGGITRRIVDFANALAGHIRGGLAQANVVSSMVFAGISGSAVAETAALGSVLIPAMQKAGYGAGFAAAITQTSAVIGPIIPPSIPMIIFAFLAEVSVGKMFVAGIIPGLLVGAGLMLAAYLISRRRASPVEENLQLSRIVKMFIRAIFALLVPLIIIGGVLGGVFTATGTGQVLIILGSASLLAFLIAEFQISKAIADGIFAISRAPWMFLLLNRALLIIGMFLENIPAMIIMVPLFFPIAMELGIDPIHFGIIVVMNTLIGLCTPPIGILIYMSANIAQTGAEVVIRESLPFIAILIAVLLLITYVPALTLWPVAFLFN